MKDAYVYVVCGTIDKTGQPLEVHTTPEVATQVVNAASTADPEGKFYWVRVPYKRVSGPVGIASTIGAGGAARERQD